MSNQEMVEIEGKSKVKSFYDLDAWKKGHCLALRIYKITKKFPKEEQYGMVSQLRRAASSVTANLAEGFARFHYKDKIRFYYQARGSAAEVQNFIILARDLGYVEGDECKLIGGMANEVGMLINGAIRSIERFSK